MGYLKRLDENNYRLRAYRIVDGKRRYVNKHFQGTIEEAEKALEEWQRVAPSPDPSQRSSPAFVYAIVPDVVNPLLVKIGRTSNVQSRLKGLATGSPVKLRILSWWKPRSIYSSEWYLHWKYRDQRSHGEWFHTTEEMLQELKSLSG